MIFNAAIIGIGRIGFTLENDKLRGGICTHSGAYNSHPNFRIAGAADIDPARLNEFSIFYNFPADKLYKDYKLLLRNEKIDIVSIAVWTDCHKQIFCDCVNDANIKLIFLEKPVALNYKDARYMMRLAKKHNKIVAVNYERRWSNIYNKIREMIISRELGELRTMVGNVLTGAFMHASWHKYLAKRGGPILHDGVHLIDLALFLCGKPRNIEKKIFKFDSRHKYEHTAFIRMEFDKNITAFLEIGGRRRYFNFELDLQFSDGRIIVGNSVLKLFVPDKSPRFTGFTELKEIPFPQPIERKPLLNALDEFYLVMSGQSDYISSTGANALETMKIIDLVVND